ncbi:hypothetical protein MMC06_005289 [Schaereria dolodes]|nr:hypothetical protein [Schaereria dolodes]
MAAKYTPTWHTTTYPAISPTKPSISAANKTVFITGGSRGIGSAIAASFVIAGASNIVLLGRSLSMLQGVKEKLENTSSKSRIHTFAADITNKAAIDQAFTTVHEIIGPIDILVNNAAYLPTPALLTEALLDDRWHGFEVNVLGSVLVTRAFLHTAAAEPVFINISSAVLAYPSNERIELVRVVQGDVRASAGFCSSRESQYESHEYPARCLDGMLVSLPADFVVWAASPEAAFLNGKYVWVNWDVEELKAQKEELVENTKLLMMGLQGWPSEV